MSSERMAATAPLAGLRVLDFTSVVVGPACTWRLAQYGAEVIKVEAPEGDLMRGLGGLSPTGQHAGTYLHLNRGKRNIGLDLKKLGARDVIARLVQRADVVVANMRPLALERLGLDAASLRARHPDIIHCLITGYGTDGPYAGRPTYDSVVQGASGVAGLFGARDGEPAYVPMVICDHVVGEIAAGAILAAVIRRRAGQGGSSLEVPMFETMAAFVLQEHLAQHSFDPPVGPAGDQRLLNPRNCPLRTADGWISVTINTDPQVRAFLRAVGREDLLDDPRFATVAARASNVREWFEIRGAGLSGKTTQAWLDIFGAADIAAMPCHTLESLCADPHLTAVGLMASEQHPTEGTVTAIRSTIRQEGAYPDPGGFAQPRGWETRAVLEETGAGLAAQATDGHTLLMISIAHAVNPALYPRLPYAEGDFVPVGPVAIVPNILVVPASRPWRSVADLVADARRRPGRLAYASAGSGTSIHLAGALFADLAGIELEHVPYRGSAPAVTDLVAGRVDAMFDSVTSASPHIASGRLVALGVTTSRRIASYPELPTMAEAGVPGFMVDPWFAMLAQRGLPAHALAPLSVLLARLLADLAVIERLERIGAEPMAGDAASLARLLAEETARWGVFIRRAGLKPE